MEREKWRERELVELDRGHVWASHTSLEGKERDQPLVVNVGERFVTVLGNLCDLFPLSLSMTPST